jgi:hypothetical protein
MNDSCWGPDEASVDRRGDLRVRRRDSANVAERYVHRGRAGVEADDPLVRGQ